jgi:tetratricopeptide (TPR) repeat protein
MVVKQAPDYAQGWNQRAFILFLQEKYDQSLSDIEKALELEPRHFGAMAGQARILMRQCRFVTGQKTLKQAVKIHPFLRERSMIVETGEKDL